MTDQSSPSVDRAGLFHEWRRGWPVVLSAGLGYGTGGAMILLTAGLFIAPMREALGWSTSAVTIAPIITLTWAACSPFSGAVIDRIGSRRAAILGSIALSICVLLLAVAPVSAVSLYGLAFLIGVSCSLTVVPTYTRAVVSWFRGGVGMALGLTLSGSAFVAMISIPLVGAAIQAYGWQAGYVALAGFILCLGLPAILLGLRERVSVAPDLRAVETPVVEGAPIRAVLKDARFWIYAFAFTVACVAVGGFYAHLQPLLADLGLKLSDALTLGVVYALSVSVGRIAGGALLDRIWPFGVAAAVLTLAAVGAIGLGQASGATAMTVFVAVVALIGLGQGAEADFIAFFSRHVFGMRAYSTIVGVFAMVTTVGISIGAFLFSALFDRYGDYRIACYIGAACLLVAAAGMLVPGIGRWKSSTRDREPLP